MSFNLLFYYKRWQTYSTIDNENNLKGDILKVWEGLVKKIITVPGTVEKLGYCIGLWFVNRANKKRCQWEYFRNY